MTFSYPNAAATIPANDKLMSAFTLKRDLLGSFCDFHCYGSGSLIRRLKAQHPRPRLKRPPPIATPTSATASAGASFTPSATIMTGPCRLSVRATSTLSSGFYSPSTAVIPASCAIWAAICASSPEATIIRSIPVASTYSRGPAAKQGWKPNPDIART